MGKYIRTHRFNVLKDSVNRNCQVRTLLTIILIENNTAITVHLNKTIARNNTSYYYLGFTLTHIDENSFI